MQSDSSSSSARAHCCISDFTAPERGPRKRHRTQRRARRAFSIPVLVTLMALSLSSNQSDSDFSACPPPLPEAAESDRLLSPSCTLTDTTNWVPTPTYPWPCTLQFSDLSLSVRPHGVQCIDLWIQCISLRVKQNDHHVLWLVAIVLVS